MHQKQMKSVICLIAILSGILIVPYFCTNSINYQNSTENSIVELDLKWLFTTDNSINTCPATADVNGDGFLEVLISSRDRNLYCITHEGILEWIYTTGSSVDSSPAVADLDNDGTVEIVLGCDDGKIYCVNHKGKLEWFYRTRRSIYSSPSIADLDGDGFFEVLIGSEDYRLYCIDNKGNQKWNYTTGSAIFSTPCVADLDNDGYLEVLTGSWDGYLHCVDSSGERKWRFFAKGVVTSSPAVADLDKDGFLEILFGSWDNNTYCLNNIGEFQWNYSTNDVTASSAGIGDLDNDGYLEILIGSGADDQSLHCINYNGSRKWTFTAGGGGIPATPNLIDLDGDDDLEVIIGCMNNKLYYLNHLGHVQDEYTTEDSIWRGSCVADLDDDGMLEILVGSYDDNLYCLTLEQEIQGKVSPWPCFMGSTYHTGWMDSDGDYLDDLTEKFYSTNMSNPDTDKDGFFDGWEVQVGLNPLIDDANDDKDNDGLTNYEEAKIFHTSLFNPDTDNDGLLDGWEIDNNHDPLKWDNWSRLLGIYLIPVWVIFAILPIIIYRHKLSKYYSMILQKIKQKE